MAKNVLKLKSFAKINLYLKIGHKLDDGYHNIESIMQTIDLFDEISFEKTDKPGIFIECNNPEVPIDKNSIVYKAAETLMNNIKGEGIKISIKKHIPISSGLGGGSSNVATVLKGICRLFSLPLNSAQLQKIATNFGMDIPFFIRGGIAFVKGRGELVSSLPPISPSIPLILINPGIKVSTRWAYQLYDKLIDTNIRSIIEISHLLNRKENIKPIEIYDVIYNSFDSILSQKFPIIEQIKNRLKNLGSIGATISGSGSTIYGIFEKKKDIIRVYNEIKGQYPLVYKAYTIEVQDTSL